MDKPVYYLILIGICIIICFIFLGYKDKLYPANNRYQSTSYTINDTMNDIMNAISLGTGKNGQKAGNLDAVVVEYKFQVAVTNYIIPHKLGRKPAGYILIFEDRHASIFATNENEWTASTITLASDNAPATVRLLIF